VRNGITIERAEEHGILPPSTYFYRERIYRDIEEIRKHGRGLLQANRQRSLRHNQTQKNTLKKKGQPKMNIVRLLNGNKDQQEILSSDLDKPQQY